MFNDKRDDRHLLYFIKKESKEKHFEKFSEADQVLWEQVAMCITDRDKIKKVSEELKEAIKQKIKLSSQEKEITTQYF